MKWSLEDFAGDRRRYEIALAALREAGYAEEHPLIASHRRRLFIIDQVLSDPEKFGLTKEGPRDTAEPS